MIHRRKDSHFKLPVVMFLPGSAPFIRRVHVYKPLLTASGLPVRIHLLVSRAKRVFNDWRRARILAAGVGLGLINTSGPRDYTNVHRDIVVLASYYHGRIKASQQRLLE